MTTTMHEKFDLLLEQDPEHNCPGLGRDNICVRLVAMAELPTRFGDFHIVAFENNRDGKEHVAITKGDVIGASNVPCAPALGMFDGRRHRLPALRLPRPARSRADRHRAMERGMVLYLRQEGRGIGLTNKVRAYSLQDDGLDTVEANLALGFRDDERDYAVAAHMLMSLKVESIQLMTNNPKKIAQLTQYGIKVNDRIPHIMPPNDHNKFYLETKAAKSGHLIDFQGHEHFPEQSDRPFIKGMTEEQVIAIQE
jgi:GTP cyclohydrolase II